ncbi:hypothetical protein CAAN1_11S00826 [[Candida] anglica]|uniref:Nitrogen regulatory protein areA GATA-like domain-containing protein n=1 Tax=[Candida] anglica TaxID=148631 RepID=A0ABP0EI96_9ASCO
MDDLSCLEVRPTFSQNIDYLAPDVPTYNLYRCWRQNNSKSIKSHQDDISLIIPSTISKRLENVCWRRWFKEIKQLPEISPDNINWYKDQDITWLYGPKFVDGSTFEVTHPSKPLLTKENLARSEAIDIVSPTISTREHQVSEYSLSSSIESDYSLEDNASTSSLESDSHDIDHHIHGSLKPALKSSRSKSKRVKFNHIVNSREIVNGMSFDYDFLDHHCL